MTKLRKPHLTSNKDHHHGKAVAPSGGMGLVGPLDPAQGRPVCWQRPTLKGLVKYNTLHGKLIS